MPFDPNYPQNGDDFDADPMRAQLHALHDEIQSIPQGPPGEPGPPGVDGAPGSTGPQGPPFASVVVDSVTTLDPGEPATVSATFDGTVVHLTIGLPRGAVGAAGAPGEVTAAQLNAALADRPTYSQMGDAITTALSDRPTTTAQAAAIAAALATAAATSSANTNAVTTLDTPFNDPPALADLEAIRAKLNEHILAARR